MDAALIVSMSRNGRKAVGPLAAQFQPSTESAPERVSGITYAREAGPDSVRATRRRKGPHSTASVL